MREADEPKWITYDQAIAIHSRQLRRFGGAAGLRDEGMLQSALERPVNKWRNERASVTELAATYAFGLVKNYPFVDGNKRIAFMTMMIFLRKNGTISPPIRRKRPRSFSRSLQAKFPNRASRAGSPTIFRVRERPRVRWHRPAKESGTPAADGASCRTRFRLTGWTSPIMRTAICSGGSWCWRSADRCG